ncbi:FG-GAP-like repeat-containing protein [Schlesneria sp. DSM 10557]|uniref:FG-GAP-like repeat-containing protein n=1 Tax=Schlesneria sp. DSM 10557 TaxID=3044399 RepID=UPI0035A15E87
MATQRSRRIGWILGAVLGVIVVVGLYRYFQPEEEFTDEDWSRAVSTVEKLAEQQRADELSPLLRDLARRKPTREKLVLRLALVSINLDDADMAATFLGQLPETEPSPGRQLLQGIVAAMKHRAADAERYWIDAVTLNPKLGAAWERLAQLYLSQIRSSDVRKAFEGLQTCRPLSVEELSAYSSANEQFYSAGERLALMEQYSKADPQDAESHTAAARYLLLDDRYPEVLALLQSRPLRPEDVRLAVEAQLRLGRLVDAEQSLKPWAESENPPSPIARARGMYAAATSHWAEAAWFLRLVVTHDPADTPAIYQLGQALDRLGHAEPAAAALRLAAKGEQLSNLIHRIRRTTHLPVRALSPLIIDACQLMRELGRRREAASWLRLLMTEGVESPRIDELRTALSADRSENVLPPELELVAAVTLSKPGTDRSINKPATSVMLEPGPSALASLPKFEDVHQSAGIDFTFEVGGIGQKWIVETLGGGVAAFDYDNDGWTDLYFAQGGELESQFRGSGVIAGKTWPAPAGKLFRNLGNGQFRDATESAGIDRQVYGQGCSAGDFDNDGDADLFVAGFGRNVFYRNNGDGSFTEISDAAQVVGTEWQTSAAFCDLNLDGNLDLYVTAYVRDPFKVCRKPDGTYTICSPANYIAADDTLYLNRGDGTFEDISQESGIRVPLGKGLGVVVADFTGDRRPDIYVANDGTPNFLFMNEGNDAQGRCRFTEIGMRSGCAVNNRGMAQAGMGIVCEDFDGNGWLDLIVTNFFNEGATLYLNQGEGYFEDQSATAGLLSATKQLLGFGIQSIDYSLSGAMGLFIANGHIGDFGERNEPWKMPPQAFSGDQRGHFVDCSKTAGDFFQAPALARAVARLDFDCDGRPDLAVTYLDRPAALLQNVSEKVGNHVRLKLVGTLSNRDGRGCRIEIEVGGQTRILESSSGDGFMSCNERSFLIGLGSAQQIDELRIFWPSGAVSALDELTENTDVVVIERAD